MELERQFASDKASAINHLNQQRDEEIQRMMVETESKLSHLMKQVIASDYKSSMDFKILIIVIGSKNRCCRQCCKFLDGQDIFLSRILNYYRNPECL